MKEQWYLYDTDSFYYDSTRWHWSLDPTLPPFSANAITAQAVHPEGRVVFLSAHGGDADAGRDRGTFSYDTARESGWWRRHGGWELPFVGQTQYDRGLRAWVGLHVRDGDAGGGGGLKQPDGHLCGCDVPDLEASAAAPDWKLGKEKLFVVDPRGHVDAKLVDMDDVGRFCLVEMLASEGVDREGCIGDGDKCELRLTTFRVRYGDGGELIATACRPALSYKLSKYDRYFRWQASWLKLNNF